MSTQEQSDPTPKRRPLLSAEDVNKWHKAAMRAVGDNEVRRKWGNTKAGSPVVTMFLCEDVSRLQIERAEMLASLKMARECIAYCRRAHKDAQSGDGVPVEIFLDETIAKAEGRS